MLKDSYANSFVPFLTQHYRRIIMVDPRYYYGNLEELKQAVRSGMNMDDICNPKFSHSVMREIRLASELNYDLTRYA